VCGESLSASSVRGLLLVKSFVFVMGCCKDLVDPSSVCLPILRGFN